MVAMPRAIDAFGSPTGSGAPSNRTQPPNCLPSWSRKVSANSVPKRAIAQISATSRTPMILIAPGRFLRLIKINRPE
jgi:hypothetical protein